MVVDIAINQSAGAKIFMIAQSYMTAQDIHVLVNQTDIVISPWYDLSKSDKLYSPESTFEKDQLKRFKQE